MYIIEYKTEKGDFGVGIKTLIALAALKMHLFLGFYIPHCYRKEAVKEMVTRHCPGSGQAAGIHKARTAIKQPKRKGQ